MYPLIIVYIPHVINSDKPYRSRQRQRCEGASHRTIASMPAKDDRHSAWPWLPGGFPCGSPRG